MHGDSVPRVACVSRHFYAQAENDQVHEIPYNRGSMALYVSCISFFRPVGRKNDIQRIENGEQAKVLEVLFAQPGKKNLQRRRVPCCRRLETLLRKSQG
jgi:hypothetical protein